MRADIAPKNYRRVMIAFNDYPTMATSFFGANLPEALEFLLVFVWTTGQLARANINALLEPEMPPGHC